MKNINRSISADAKVSGNLIYDGNRLYDPLKVTEAYDNSSSVSVNPCNNKKLVSTENKICIAAFITVVIIISIFIIPNLGRFDFILG